MELTGQRRRSVAYFSMEIGMDEIICTYSGGLGILAGDTIRSAADFRVPMAAVKLLYRKGYFRQRLEADGWQREEPTSWAFDELLHKESPRAQVTMEGRTVHLRAWRCWTRRRNRPEENRSLRRTGMRSAAVAFLPPTPRFRPDTTSFRWSWHKR